MKKTVVTAALVILLLAVACSNNDPVSLIITPPCLEYMPAGSGTIATRVGDGASCDMADVEFVASDVADVYGASFTVMYDSSVVNFIGFSNAGSFLGTDGTTLLVQADQPTPGQVVVGITRTITSSGATPTAGDDLLISLIFARVTGSNATGSLSILEAVIEGPGQPPVTICGGATACTVGSGTLTITQ